MPQQPDRQLDFAFTDMPAPPRQTALEVVATEAGKPLSPAQAEFNRLMKRLDRARARLAREEAKLDRQAEAYVHDILPLEATLARVNFEMVQAGCAALDTVKLTPRRTRWFKDLLSTKACDLLADPLGLETQDIEWLDGLVQAFGTPEAHKIMAEIGAAEFEEIKEIIQSQAAQAGIEMDLDDLTQGLPPEEFDRILRERFAAADAQYQANNANATSPPRRKPTKAQLAREQQRQAMEEAKTRTFRALFKQLAKLMHPDLETDPEARKHKEDWMKRLTTAYENGDLRGLLEIELEWLGDVAGNLAAATDEKLRAYSMVLKEQIEEVLDRIDNLPDSPRYQRMFDALRRFSPWTDDLFQARFLLEEGVAQHRKMLEILKAGDAETRKLIATWVDSHARASARPAWLD